MTTSLIHPTAIIDPTAELDSTVKVGAYSRIGPAVQIGADTEIASHCVIDKNTRIGRGNKFYQFASVGADPQDKKYAGELTRLEIGDHNTIREFVTLNRGTIQDKGVTRIGSHNWIMAYVHVAHDCLLGDQIILANTVNLAGHVEIGDWAILGGYTGVHQFCKVGAHAMTGVSTVVLHDLPPFVMAMGNTAEAHGINSEGLKRRGFDSDRINRIRRAYKILYKNGLTFEQAKQTLSEQLKEEGDSQDIRFLLDFLARVTRGIVR
jgi:UDP-N-acetylglucosamine acyltransferase